MPLRHFAQPHDRSSASCCRPSSASASSRSSSYLPTYFQMAYRTTRDRVGPRPDRDGVRDAGQQPRDRLARQPHGPLSASSRSSARRSAPAGLLIMALLPIGLPLWVPMLAMGLVGIGTGCVHEHHRRRRAERGSAQRHRQRSPRRVNLVRQIGSTAATAIIGGSSAPASPRGCRRRWMPRPSRRSSCTRQSAAVAGSGRRALRERVRADLHRRSPSPTPSASSPRSCCRRPAVGRARTPHDRAAEAAAA